MIPYSYWWDQYVHFFKHTGCIPSQTDTVIIGAGFAGLITAFAIRHHNPRTKIILLDKGPFAGYKSSGRQIGAAFNGSYLLPSIQKNLMGTNFNDAFKTSDNNNSSLIALLKTLDINYDSTGYLTTITDSNDFSLLEESEEILASMGKDSRIYNISDLSHLSSLFNIKSGFYNSDAVTFNPFELTNKLVFQLANDKNILIYFNSSVESINRRYKMPVVMLDNGHTIKCKNIIHCNSSTWRDLMPDLKIQSNRQHVIAMCPANNLHNVLSTIPVVNYNNNSGFKFVFHNNRILCETDLSSKGSTEDDSLVEQDSVNSILERITTLMPYTADLSVDYKWSYISHSLPNLIPFVAKLSEKEYVNSLYGDNEFGFAVSMSNGLISNIFGDK